MGEVELKNANIACLEAITWYNHALIVPCRIFISRVYLAASADVFYIMKNKVRKWASARKSVEERMTWDVLNISGCASLQ